jgi:hypothetical protein
MNVENEIMFSTLAFMKTKLGNRLNEHLLTIVGISCNIFFILENSPCDAIFNEWKNAKVQNLKMNLLWICWIPCLYLNGNYHILISTSRKTRWSLGSILICLVFKFVLGRSIIFFAFGIYFDLF